ncbi:hypothetical protein EYF80_039615 [Liparis tanakae]|uniref:Uncharacterized protein n=1 Tax=Liparis tanakae TaxID=230148 RepID=A0A4Z2GAE6_9TELE|nr:hypothetical protein EYF80_039615 [Liparis tanakae]
MHSAIDIDGSCFDLPIVASWRSIIKGYSLFCSAAVRKMAASVHDVVRSPQPGRSISAPPAGWERNIQGPRHTTVSLHAAHATERRKRLIGLSTAALAVPGALLHCSSQDAPYGDLNR